MQSIFEFIDYRQYLSHYYQFKKETFPHFSYRFFSQKIGINSPSFLKHVIDGKRSLTPSMTDRFAKALNLSVRETRYFRNLVLFNQATTSGEKQEHYAVLRSMAGSVKESILGVDYYDYFSTWYTPVIRELVCLYDFQDDFKKMAAVLIPAITPGEAKQAVALLLRQNLIDKKIDGTYQQTSSALIADSSITSLAVRSFTHTMLDHCKAALDNIDKKERHVSGLTMGISPEAYRVITSEIEAFKERIKIIVNRDTGGDRIYQLNIGMFPVSSQLSPAAAETIMQEAQ